MRNVYSQLIVSGCWRFKAVALKSAPKAPFRPGLVTRAKNVFCQVVSGGTGHKEA